MRPKYELILEYRYEDGVTGVVHSEEYEIHSDAVVDFDAVDTAHSAYNHREQVSEYRVEYYNSHMITTAVLQLKESGSND
jgi:hypothetical protein